MFIFITNFWCGELQVMWSILAGAFFLGNAAPSLREVSMARGSAAYVFHVIDRLAPIDTHSDQGQKPKSMRGTVQFKDVAFAYPARKDISVLRKLTLNVDAGQTVAFVGLFG